MSYDKMELSPKVDMDLNDTSLSFISGLSCKDDDDDCVILSESLNSESQIDAGDLLKGMDPTQDLFNLNSLSSEPSDNLINAIAEGSDFSLGESSLNAVATTTQQTPVNFLTTSASSPVKTIDWQGAKLVGPSKPGQPQLLILQKQPPSTSLTVQKQPAAKAGSQNVAIVQTSTSNAKFLNLNALSLSTSGNSKTNDVKILLSQISTGSSPAYVTAKPVTTLSNPIKRAMTPSSSGQMVTKVIITNNTVSNASMVSPVPVSGTVTNATGSGQSQSILLASPNKTYTLSKNNIFNLNNSHQMLKPILGTPAKQYVLSPVRPYQKPGFTQATYARSPRRIAPATNIATPQISTLNSGTKVATLVYPSSMSEGGTKKISVTPSPTKVILKPATQTILKPPVNIASPNLSSVTTATSQPSSSVPAIQVPGSKLHYVRLVSAPTTTTATVTGRKETTILPASGTTSVSSNIVTVSSASNVGTLRKVPIAPARLVAPKQATPKFLMPSGSQLRGATSVSTPQLSQLQSGTFISMSGGNSSYVILPPQYQLQQPPSTQTNSRKTQMLNILPAPSPTLSAQSGFIPVSSGASNNFKNSAPYHSPRRATPVDTDNRQRKPCNCTKSMCLKLYCDCFANGEFCNNCNCNNCYNNLAHEEERQKAIKACLDRNPLAFHPKIGKSREGNDHERRHTKGCNCKRSYCLKNYCECYEAKILCTSTCKCVGCKNFEDSSERITLMHLVEAVDVRFQQQACAKSSSDIFDFPTKPPVATRSGERLPFAFVTDSVLEATCHCLLTQASEAEKYNVPEEEIERMVLEEFGRCLKQIIDCANKTKVLKMEDDDD